ncbi:unnamed protein product, partial [Adineta ricciae]
LPLALVALPLPVALVALPLPVALVALPLPVALVALPLPVAALVALPLPVAVVALLLLLQPLVFDVSGNYCWSQTGVVLCDTSFNPIKNPTSVNIGLDDTVYLAGHRTGQVLMCSNNTIVPATPDYGDHIDFITIDKNDSLYTNCHNTFLVRHFSSSSPNGTIVAGSGSIVTGTLTYPVGTAVDSDFNLYIGDQRSNQVMKLAPNSSSLSVVISASSTFSKLSALLLPHGSSDKIYLSDEYGTNVYLWEFGASTPNTAYTNVATGPSTLKYPRGMKLDPEGNLYVADQRNSRIVMYCVNSTLGIVVVNTDDDPVDLAFDSSMNMYVLLDDGKLLKYGRT